ncbi:AMP-dependent synthetase/ligase [Actinacidiphila oryziradicis]|uniref:Acyl-CoA synthetase n=1 Tax=Actinacidiphila oryziradicis TaxID=2571141 RepID=A0A4U0SSS7_9ACTN|nr:long-chain fatty acid--CoA ligase [Actinacidiphila oryziradicis]
MGSPQAVEAVEVVEPEKAMEGGRVVQALVAPFVRPVTSGSLADIPFANAAEAPDEPVLSRQDAQGDWHDITAAAFRDQVMAVAKGLIAFGLQSGERLAIMARTTYEWTLLDFAAWAAGLITVPIYPTSSASQAGWILEDSGAAACAVESVEQTRLISAQRRELTGLRHLWQIDAGAVEQLIAAGRDLPNVVVQGRRSLLGPAGIATLVYTSGTTGRPKGCVLTHGNFFSEVDNAIEMLYPVFKGSTDEPASTLLFLPLSHVFGRMVAIGCLRARVRLGHAPSIATEDLLADLAGFRPTFLLAIPYVLEKVFNTGRATAESMGRASSFDRAASIARQYGEALVARRNSGTGRVTSLKSFRLKAAHRLYEPLVYRRIRAALGGRVRHVICGGSPLGRSLAAFYTGIGVEIFEGYGLTETTAAATVTPPLRPRLGTVGWPLPGTAVRIAPDGEVLISGGQVFTGYWNSSVGAEPALHQGWFATGDIGELDEDGYLTITGRKKEMIITAGGKNVAPAPLEDRLRAHPLVGQCMVVGEHRSYVAALVTLDPDGLSHWKRIHHKESARRAALAEDPELLADIQHAVDDANATVSRAESIRRFAVLPVDLTEADGHLTPSMKLRRSAVAADFAKEIEALYTKP